MSTADIIILIVTLLLVGVIIFFHFVYPRLKHRPSGECSNCAQSKKGSKLVKYFHKQKKKDENK